MFPLRALRDRTERSAFFVPALASDTAFEQGECFQERFQGTMQSSQGFGFQDSPSSTVHHLQLKEAIALILCLAGIRFQFITVPPVFISCACARALGNEIDIYKLSLIHI